MSFYLMHRGWLEHDALDDGAPFCRRAAWAWLIDHAEYAARQVRIGRQLITLKRGQLSCSLRFLARAWGWGHERVRRFLRDLAERDMIETASVTARETAQSLITICNYERYQSPEISARQHARQVWSQTRDESKRKKKGEANRTVSLSEETESAAPCARAREPDPAPSVADTPDPPPAAAHAVPTTPSLAPSPEVAAAEGKAEFLDGPVERFAPPQAPPAEAAETPQATLRDIKKRQLVQKCCRYVNATMTGKAQLDATLGLMGEDTEHDAQWWLDTVDKRRKREGWDDMREWREMAGLAAAGSRLSATSSRAA